MANRDFSVLKWIVFPAVTVGLSIGIAFFNLRVFGLEGSFQYLIALGVVNLISGVMLKFTGSTKRGVRLGAYVFEGLLILALLINSAYSLSAMRDLSMVAQAGASHERALELVTKLKSGRAQREAVGQLGNVVDVRSAFGNFEAVLFWIMIAELGLSLGGLFTVYGLAAIKPGMRRMPRGAFIGARGVVTIASEPAKAGLGFGSGIKSNGGQINENGGASQASWNHEAPLRITGQASGVRVRSGGKYKGFIPWPQYLEGVRDPKRPTESELYRILEAK